MPEKSRAKVHSILRGPALIEIVAARPARSGWRRRPEFDRVCVTAWERPDGTICGVARGEPHEPGDM